MNSDVPVYRVVMNDEQQYSIWPADRANAPGWRDEGMVGTREECLAHVDRVWTDMRPASLRASMATQAEVAEAADESDEAPLVDRLCAGDHSICVDAVRRDLLAGGYVHVRFTSNETELGVRVTEVTETAGRLRIEGQLVLDFVPVQCIVDVDGSTLHGTGRLRRT